LRDKIFIARKEIKTNKINNFFLEIEILSAKIRFR